METCEHARISHLTQELEIANGRIESFKHAMRTLDEHGEHLMVAINYYFLSFRVK